MNVDYIVVGSGLAGSMFCQLLEEHKKTFVVITDDSQSSSKIAAGVYNPIVLKRFTKVWKAEEQLKLVYSVYSKLEKLLQIKIHYKIPVLRVFASIEEQNNWIYNSDKLNLSTYLSHTIIDNDNKRINAPFGLGKVNHTGRIDTLKLLTSYEKHLISKKYLDKNTFNYKALKYDSQHVYYKNYKAKHIVFAEGYRGANNPFFKSLPLVGTKGELLTIKASKLKLKYIIKSGIFIIPLGHDLYTVGATYHWEDKSNNTTQSAKVELLNKLNVLINCKYTIINHTAAIRPTVKDIRPLIGRHLELNNYYILNGLGTRGVMIAPYIAQQLYHFIEHKQALNPEIEYHRML